MIRKILVPVRGDGKGKSVLAYAAALAKRSGAHVEVVHSRPRAEDMLPFGVVIPRYLREQMLSQTHQLADEEEATLRQEIEALARSYGMTPVEKQTQEAGTFAWIEEAGKQVDVIKNHGRLSDLIAVARPDRDRNLGFNTLKAALFNTGRPVMMCPPTDTPPGELGRHVSIAWNGSVEAVRAVVMMRRVIEAADTVTVISSGSEARGTTATEYVEYLALRDIAARIETFKPGRRVGEDLLRVSKDIGADLMIMGAYGDSHERETIFGGNTQSVVDGATLPVVLVH